MVDIKYYSDADGNVNVGEIIPISVSPRKIKIYAIDEKGEETLVKDLYWFEEQGVHDFEGEALWGGRYNFRIEIEMPSKKKN